ncbi:unnamed protein product [Clavelina lepadiformis]|uniref:Myb/SANT-like DNA-binding domain-containing protein n=1 Tax=Clavelina lepadiformis TaxID=159417 RepID=A0ABP0G276_CLALP
MKRTRTENFSSSEHKLLTSIINENGLLKSIECKKLDKWNLNKKREAWNRVTELFNNQSPRSSPCSQAQLQTLWKNMKTKQAKMRHGGLRQQEASLCPEMGTTKTDEDLQVYCNVSGRPLSPSDYFADLKTISSTALAHDVYEQDSALENEENPRYPPLNPSINFQMQDDTMNFSHGSLLGVQSTEGVSNTNAFQQQHLHSETVPSSNITSQIQGCDTEMLNSKRFLEYSTDLEQNVSEPDQQNNQSQLLTTSQLQDAEPLVVQCSDANYNFQLLPQLEPASSSRSQAGANEEIPVQSRCDEDPLLKQQLHQHEIELLQCKINHWKKKEERAVRCEQREIEKHDLKMERRRQKIRNNN